MKILHAIVFFVMIFLATDCDAEITGKVVDAETGEPIESAVVLVEWIITKGLPGMSYSESYEVKEELTDKEGKVSISGVLNPFTRRYLTIYKKGYVAWNSVYIFPDYKKRTDFKWQSDYVFKLDKFKSEYGYIAHTRFIRDAIHSGMALRKKESIEKAFEWEDEMAFQERQRKGLR